MDRTFWLEALIGPLGFPLAILIAVCAGSLAGALVSCESAPQIESVSWRGEGAIEVETTIATVHASVAYVGLLEPDGSIGVAHCPYLVLEVSGAIALRLEGVPPSTTEVWIDPRCAEELGALEGHPGALREESEP